MISDYHHPYRFHSVVPPFLVLGLILIMSGCAKEEGRGGTGSISGAIMEQFYNDDYSLMIYQSPAVDEEVFLMYGEDQVLGDRTFTSYTGAFSFEFLYPGRYTVYYSTEDTASDLGLDREVMVRAELERGEDLDLGNLVKITTLDYDDGGAVIKGVVRVIDYVDESRWPNLVIEYTDFAHEHEVYLTYGNHAFYDERIRTQYDGYFEFSRLIPGDYLIFLYSDDVTRNTKHVVLKFNVTITEMDQVVDLGEITIEKL